MDLEEIADELYALTPDEFTAARTEYEKQAKADGDKELSRQVKALRKPTVVAWLSNLLARERPDSLAPLRELGETLREAQQSLQGDELRELSRQRQRLVNALATEARKLAAGHDVRVTEQVIRELEDVLQATLADPDVADTVLAGRLTSAVQHAGFGVGGVVAGAARSSSQRATPARRSPTRARAPAADGDGDELAARRRTAALQAARADVEDAEQALAEARVALEDADDAATEAEREQDALAERITRLEEELAAAEEQLPALRKRARAVARDRDKAEVTRDRMQRMLAKAREALTTLED